MPTSDSNSLNIFIAASTKEDAPFRDSLLEQLRKRFHSLNLATFESPHDHAYGASHGASHDGKDTRYECDTIQAQRCAWADMLILAPLDADSLARMLHGLTGSCLLQLLRGWNVAKKILVIPAMSASMWENPMTKKQLSKIRRKWKWIRVVPPLLWTWPLEGGNRQLHKWDGMEELLEAIGTQVDLMTIGYGMEVPLDLAASLSSPRLANGHVLPPELWSMILEFTNDWELATALGVHTALPTPTEWLQTLQNGEPKSRVNRLEWTMLTGRFTDIRAILEEERPRSFSRLSIKLIMRFAMVSLLGYLEKHHRDLFWSTFGHTFLPDKASSVFGRVELLEYWRTSPAFLAKDYTAAAIDGASRQGFVRILDWWQSSGLPLRYSEAALEQASSRGHVSVLEWWEKATHDSPSENGSSTLVTLKIGKSIPLAAQSGSVAALRWWVNSGLPLPNASSVPKIASTHGHVSVLTFWLSTRGGANMAADNQVLVGATKMGHRAVLEWWKRSGLRVEYKTCDIEEALEDGVEGKQGEAVRRWWASNGLNLGVGTSEWMRTKVL